MGFSLLAILLILWLIFAKGIWRKILGLAAAASFIILLIAVNTILGTKELTQNDVYGQYVIDRTKFSGRQSDWQYDHFKFEITKQDEFIFYQTDNNKVTNVYKGKAKFIDGYIEPRLVLQVDSPRHHIIEDMPTLYRTRWNFYYVFHSPKFGNVFFTKGRWHAMK